MPNKTDTKATEATTSTKETKGKADQPAKTPERDFLKAKRDSQDAIMKGAPLGEAVGEIDVNLIDPNPFQPRVDFAKVQEIAASIKDHGQDYPIIVRKKPDGRYEVADGETRLRACRDVIKSATVKAVVREFDEQQMALTAFRTAYQRKDLNPMEEARGLQRIIDQFKLTANEAAEKLNVTKTVVIERTRLLKLDEVLQRHIEDGKLSPGQAIALNPLKGQDPVMFPTLVAQTIDGDLSVAKIRAMGKAHEDAEKAKEAKLQADAGLTPPAPSANVTMGLGSTYDAPSNGPAKTGAPDPAKFVAPTTPAAAGTPGAPAGATFAEPDLGAPSLGPVLELPMGIPQEAIDDLEVVAVAFKDLPAKAREKVMKFVSELVAPATKAEKKAEAAHAAKEPAPKAEKAPDAPKEAPAAKPLAEKPFTPAPKPGKGDKKPGKGEIVQMGDKKKGK